MNREEKLTVLDETFEHYHMHPERLAWSVEMDHCAYAETNAAGEPVACAVGRYIPEDGQFDWFREYAGSFVDVAWAHECDVERVENGTQEELVYNLRDIPMFSNIGDDEFWERLQDAHDNAASHIHGGLQGKKEPEEIWADFAAEIDSIRNEVRRHQL